MYIKEKETLPSNISKYNLAREKQIILLMITKEEKEGSEVKSKGRKWHYLAVKRWVHYYIERFLIMMETCID